ncbi:MAG: hypothetical protein PUG24_02390 [Eubacteriales bacterium]|nr:hypothetical protein [Eubacteriales bacterium]
MRKIFLHFGKTGVTLAPLPFLLKMIPVFGLIRVVFPQAAVLRAETRSAQSAMKII